ncbi:metal-dependent hydrolase [Cohnella thailandensis]|uniref:Metal-dependent hydrolase n=1 Tax=Cohnella thailandensis TaxID=557557 RepID=A0A841T7F2_9BACL|nr:metal-dependent hydrolase [Cohnella thailandensis]MBB6638198.1 metal-dependent hydrolase [Cohnella thailandensis]MBP1977756.1 inner membrane protein [Cohnella thailandensis]
MKGSTHLAIGTAIGAVASAYYPFHLQNAVCYVAVAAVSALSPDLDGTSLLSSKLGKLSHWVRESALWTGVLSSLVLAYFFFAERVFYPKYAILTGSLVLLGLIMKEGALRNAMVSLCGIGLLYAGWSNGWNWLMGLGVFVAWAPWLNHRGLTHTVWAVAAWGWIAAGLESHLAIEGITVVAIAGYLSHLAADTLTPSGVKWLYPILRKSFRLPFRL